MSWMAACTSEEPACIDMMITVFQQEHEGRTATGIYTFELDSETFYVFDNGVAFDATASVVNSSCDQVCVYGGLRGNSPQPCDDYWDGINNSTQIWP